MKIKIECTAEELREFVEKKFFGNKKKIFIPEDDQHGAYQFVKNPVSLTTPKLPRGVVHNSQS